MITREDIITYAPARDLSLLAPRNWTAFFFFAVLSVIHLSIATAALLNGRWEGYLSLLLGAGFAIVAAGACLTRYEMTILAAQKTIRVRNAIGPFRFQRFVSFDEVSAVRLTLGRRARAKDSTIEVLCANQDIECPATPIPRQQALFLAVLMRVQLIKVIDGDAPNRLAGRNSDRLL